MSAFGAIKMHFGRTTLAADLEAVRIVREAIGPGVRLMSDFNQGLDRGEALLLYMPDLMRIGGVTGWLRCAAIAGAAGLPLSSHLYPEFSAHLLRVPIKRRPAT